MKNNSENIILENLGKNISKQLEKRDWSQKTFAEKLRYADTEFSPHQTDIFKYLCGTVEMGFYELLCICQVLEVHSSVLLATTKQPKAKYQTITYLNNRHDFKQAFGKQLTHLIHVNREKINSFSAAYTDAAYHLGFSDSRSPPTDFTLYRYQKGLRNPLLLNAVILCQLFNIELSDFFNNPENQ